MKINRVRWIIISAKWLAYLLWIKLLLLSEQIVQDLNIIRLKGIFLHFDILSKKNICFIDLNFNWKWLVYSDR